MIVKFHKQSERIKGLSFHPTRPWLLAGLITGNIQLWDYRLGRVIEEYKEHESSVRSVEFHPSLSLFISSSDDLTIRVWNYKTKKCQFILRGHMDFVRCVSFHPELPWCVSGSDDQTARIWNYQSRQMLSIITGHAHYVMRCEFHSTQDYLITCSLDQTIRLWSFSQLKKKFMTKSIQQDNNELELVQILDGHNQGVNWCSFHPTQNLIVSSSDDKKIKIWKFSETRCYEIESFNGHTNNVNCVLFHPKCDVLISNSEDKTQRIWDLKKKLEVDCFTNKELDRFWVAAVHKDSYYFAAGSDSALYICTLYKDRPPMDFINQQYLCIGYQKQIKLIDMKTQQEKLLRNLSDISSIQDNILQDNIEFIQYNIYDTSKTQLLIRLKQNQHNKLKNICKFIIYEQQTNIIQMFLGKTAVFVGKSKVIRSKENTDLELYNYETDQHTLINYKAERVFSYLGGKIIFYNNNAQLLCIFDPLSNQIIQSCSCTIEFNNIKKIIYNQCFIAVQTKKGIYIFTKQLQTMISIQESINIKSILFLSETQNIILYTTKAHLKYLLLNGDSGILKTTENILYLVQIQQPIDKQTTIFKIYFMDNQWQLRNYMIDCQELLFKQALYDKNIKYIQDHLKNKKKQGEALVSYLYQKQYSVLAINLVEDKKAKFQLALSSNNLEVAYRNCEEIKDLKNYQQLLEESMRQGNHNIVEVCLQKLRYYEQLTFLYTITGQFEKLKILENIAKEQGNLNNRFQDILYLGDYNQQIQFLKECNLNSLANLSTFIHGQQLQNNNSIHPEDLEWINNQDTQALIPPFPIIKSNKHPLFSINWPHNFVGEDELLQLAGEENKVNQQLKQEDVLIIQTDQNEQNKPEESDDFQDCHQWGIDEEELIDQTPPKLQPLTKTTIDQKALRSGYPDYKKNLHPGEMIVTEHYEQCITNLKKQINLEKTQILQENLKSMALYSIMEISQIPFLIHAPLVVQEIQDKIYIKDSTKNLLKQGYKQTTEGKFNEALNTFQQILKQIIFIRNNEDLLPICLNYIVAMKCELGKINQSILRQIELSCYMAICDLQPAHRSLTLRAAMSLAYKNKNYLTGSQIARYLIQLLQNAPSGSHYAKQEVIENAKKIQKACDQYGVNEHKINFNEQLLDQGISNLCTDTLTLKQKIYKCHFDGAPHSQQNILCSICEMCQIK